jgi:hypothetical protein
VIYHIYNPPEFMERSFESGKGENVARSNRATLEGQRQSAQQAHQKSSGCFAAAIEFMPKFISCSQAPTAASGATA